MKVTKIWDFGIDFFLGSRSQESDLDWRFGYWFLFRSQIIRLMIKIWVWNSFQDRDYKKVIKIRDLGIGFFSESR